MTTLQSVMLLLFGGFVGGLSGLLGIGGGVLVIPALVFLFGFSQQRAVGTSLAMLLPPIGVFAVLKYAKAGLVDWRAAMIMAAAFALGAVGGSSLATRGVISERGLRVFFAVFLLYISGNMLFRGDQRVWSTIKTLAIGLAYAVSWLAFRAVGKSWERKLDLLATYKERIEGPEELPDYEI
ncbi:MAG: sulfite exporter TauE/SafE family protein [Deltaproteobacteria bacterium]|nr:sulfite exporter TauE/SafE family protein [Deltaproteobacteria bacterium]